MLMVKSVDLNDSAKDPISACRKRKLHTRRNNMPMSREKKKVKTMKYGWVGDLLKIDEWLLNISLCF